MKTELHYYDIYPKVFPTGKEIEITVKPLGDHAKFKNPENVVLRVLGIEDGHIRDFPKRNNNQAVDYTVDEDGTIRFKRVFAKEQQYLPYYLYRQKNMAGNFENVGYAKADKAGIYNILIMEEKQTIVAIGAGTISKRVYSDGRIERCDNVKDVALYIEKIDEMIDRKRKLYEE